MKLLYLIPHCSTGGMPQYLLKQIEEFKDSFDITVIEVNFYGNLYVVQRNKIKKLVSFQSLHGNQDTIKDVLDDISPDIIHCQELPESFLKPQSLDILYDKNRKWSVVVTTHSSLTKGSDFTHIPDRIVAVNNWQKELFLKDMHYCDVDVWEYPIEDKSPDKEGSRSILGIPEGYHVLNVGLFTPGKNQGELFEIARHNPDITYHFVGNQAPNFQSYWGPLMENKPDNCVVWGERDDVDLFYQACDEMYFMSKFELNPLCIKEALSYGMHVKMYKLPSYGTDYDNNPLVNYL